jgi:integrase
MSAATKTVKHCPHCRGELEMVRPRGGEPFERCTGCGRGAAAVTFPYNTFIRHFAKVVTNAGLIAGREDPQGVTFHTLRHTFASWMIMSGQVDLYTVAQLLGDTLQVVEDTYAHLAPDFKKRAIEAIKGTIAIPSLATTDATTATGTATLEPISC